MSPVIRDWTEAKAASFGAAALAFRHELHLRPLFTDEGLVSLLDRYPRERLGVFTMGEDVADWRSWRRGSAEGLSGERLLEAVRSGRLWLNLRDANRHLPEYHALCEEIAEEKARETGQPILNRDLGVLISSPLAEVLYHLDVPLSSLWQIRGRKTFRLYPRRAPFVTEAQIESFVLREAEGQFAFDPAWDAAAATFEMQPGDMLTWAQNAPHRVTNGPMLNVSLSMEFMTPAARLRANVLYANGVLRRRLGLDPKLQERLGPAALAKVALARGVKARAERRARRTYTPILKPSFTLPPEAADARPR